MKSNDKRVALLLGTYHMSNPGLDIHNAKADDVLAPKRQQELKEVVERLKLFNPTKVAIEALVDSNEALNKDYHSYLSGDFTLTANEIHQLGFRTAAELGHERIYPVDWNEWTGGISLGDVYDYAKLHLPEMYKHFNSVGEENIDGFQKAQSVNTIRELLLECNNHNGMQRDLEKYYMNIARVGDGKNNIGVDWLCNYWYRRNMIIYTNISRISSTEDRILVIYGAGHMHLLTQFMKESGIFSLEPVEKYLGNTLPVGL
ncbi:DUF5694 domain-containing protein [Heyndrickxia sp. NPDC080065]|uniref:DUF5694 domain-containing protein n=1 Tax=Heyndrickxia sp. NPDC080065 TaxID=3390568 RepID=UPI003D011761